MICPRCQSPNQTNAKFCFNCGQALTVRCTNCGVESPFGAKFCPNCGHALAQAAVTPAPAEPTPAAPVDRLRRYIPREFADRLENARSSHAMEGDRRIVTILFCDVKGSTAMAERLDPEEWAEIMNGAFEHLIPPVYKYEGTVARLMGDAILAFFGAPIAHEDDPQRAVLAGLGIVEGIQDYRAQVKHTYGLDFDVRVGINTGLVVVGAVGSDLRLEYTAMGDAVNLAARMEQTAQPSTVQIAHFTQRLIAPLFEFEDLGGIEVKGKAEPVPAYRVLRPKAAPGRLRGIEGLESPLIGRDREVQALQAALNEVGHGRGQIVSVMGEAGLGKSRLLAEVRQSLISNPQSHEEIRDWGLEIRWAEGRSLSYEMATPYAAFRDLFNRHFGLSPDLTDYAKYARVEAAVAEAAGERTLEIAPFLASAIGLALSGEALDSVRFLEPPQLRGRVFAAAAEYIGALAAQRPLVVVFDDVHWMDPTSLDLVEQLLPLTDQAALMIVLVLRPQPQEASWRLHKTADRDYGHRYTQLSLKPLDGDESRQLVANLLEIEDLPEKVRVLILNKAEGNPFFVEEVIRSLLDAKLVVRVNSHWQATRDIESIAVPDTIAGVITARFDRLGETSRHAAQTAAVIGREFGLKVLAEVHDAADELHDALADLQRRELVREKSRLPDTVFLFKHVLTQETIYSSILLRQRREMHRRVAEALERSAPERVNDLARHFLEAREPARALPYLIDAADRAAHAYSSQEAVSLYSQALTVLKTVDDLALARRAYEGLGGAYSLTNDIPAAIETYQAMLALGRERGEALMQISALNKMAATYALRMGQFQQADEFLREAEHLAKQEQDKGGLSELFVIRCQMCTATADFQGVLTYMGQAVELGRELNSKDQMAQGLEHISNTHMFMGQFDEAWRATQDGLRVSREIGNKLHEAGILAMPLPAVYLRNGDLDAARRSAEEGVEIATRIGAIYPMVYGSWALGELARLRGEYETALYYQEAAVARSLPFEQFMPFLTVQALGALGAVQSEISQSLASTAAQHHQHALKLLDNPAGMFGGGTAWADVGYRALTTGDVVAAKEVFAKGLNTPTMFMVLQKPRHLVGTALVALVEGQAEAALGFVAEARAFAEERRMKNVFPLIAWAEGETRLARDEPEAALTAFQQAEASASEMGMRPMVVKARLGAARALEALHRQPEAEAQRQAARQMVDEIARLFQDAELRARYLEDATSFLAAAG